MLVAVTFAPTMAAPLGSRTVPAIVPVGSAAQSGTQSNIRSVTITSLMFVSIHASRRRFFVFLQFTDAIFHSPQIAVTQIDTQTTRALEFPRDMLKILTVPLLLCAVVHAQIP